MALTAVSFRTPESTLTCIVVPGYKSHKAKGGLKTPSQELAADMLALSSTFNDCLFNTAYARTNCTRLIECHKVKTHTTYSKIA